MGMTNFYQGSLRYDIHGRKRKTSALKKARKPKAVFNSNTSVFKNKTNELAELRRQQAKQYKSLMEESIKDGTFMKNGGRGDAKETLKYTGSLVKGIATMHKSNAVPVIDQKQAEEISRMGK